MPMVSSKRKGDQIAQNGDDSWKILNPYNSSFAGQTPFPSTLHSSWATCIRPVLTGCGPRKASWIIQTCVVLFHESGKCNFPSQFAGMLIESAHGDMAAHGHQRTVALNHMCVCFGLINGVNGVRNEGD